MIKPTFNRTKIIATIGPACSDKETLKKMVERGMDVCRLNFSHGRHEDHDKVINSIRQINKENNLHICILADLQGPKLRVGNIKNNHLNLTEGEVVILTNQKGSDTQKGIYINYHSFPGDAKTGDRVLLDDGKIELKVIETDQKEHVKAKVLYGGELQSNKGFNLPNTKISLPSLTQKDLEDLEFILDIDPEWLALSFVRTARDIKELKKILENRGSFTKVIAKIEKPDALENIDEIIEVSDGIMIARGDLGVEIPMEEIPLLQKSLVNKCIKVAKPVIIATQIMESMIENPRPTRAESNDVANAVIDRADALMLSGETSVGKYPIKVIEQMEKIIENVEREASIFTLRKEIRRDSGTFVSDAICQNAVQLAKEINAQAIIGMTKSGYTAFQISSHRPGAFIHIFSDNVILLNTLNLVWGVRGFYYDKFISTDQTFVDVINILKRKNFLKPGDMVINTASMPIQEKGRTNMVKVSYVN